MRVTSVFSRRILNVLRNPLPEKIGDQRKDQKLSQRRVNFGREILKNVTLRLKFNERFYYFKLLSLFVFLHARFKSTRFIYTQKIKKKNR